MRDCAASISPSGLLRSHWPSAFEQIIATYSLQWIGMLHDHYRHFNRPSAWADLLPTARGIIAWFANRTRSDGLLGHIAEATFIDWAFTAGCPPQDQDGGSALLTALVAESAMMLADLEQVGGYPELASAVARASHYLESRRATMLGSEYKNYTAIPSTALPLAPIHKCRRCLPTAFIQTKEPSYCNEPSPMIPCSSPSLSITEHI